MPKKPVFSLADLSPLDALRLRPAGAYAGTRTEPGRLVSDGKVLFALNRVPSRAVPLAERLTARRADAEVVSQQQAARFFRAASRGATKKLHVLGQCRKPGWVPAASTENVAVLRYGRGPHVNYVFVNAHRLLLLRSLLDADEMLCASREAPVVLRRAGRPVGVLTTLQIDPAVAR